MLLAASIATALRFAFASRSCRDPAGDIVLGCAAALSVAALHSRFEWILVTYASQYMLAINLGVIAGLVRARAENRRTVAKPAAPASAASLVGGDRGSAAPGV